LNAEASRGEATGQGPPFHRLSLTHSFRSTRPILEFVDAAIGVIPEPGLGPIGALEPHGSEVKGPGTVALWPPVVTGGSEEDEEDWVDDATRELARRIARQVRDWLDPAHPLILESKGRPLRPEDVMILVKRRGELASLIVARLYAEGVAVAGIDRLRLNTPLGVQDLLAAVRFVLQPDDDLSLASLLVSPLIGWTQDELMHAAVKRGRKPLWRHLRETQGEDRLAPLSAMLGRADLATPYRFLEELLSGPLDGRRKLLRRLGEEARDPIDELLGAALQFVGLATPSLQGFLDWFDRGEVEIKRDPSQPLDAVRVMTAHGAKGLQAPLVILADATVDPERSPRATIDWSPDGVMPGLPILRPGKAERAEPFASLIAEAEEREIAEHWRLFYVAATRAEERLVIAGALGPMAKGVPPKLSWYAAAAQAMDALGVETGEGERAFQGREPQPPVRSSGADRREAAAAVALPGWARAPAPQESRPPRPLAPSSLGEDDVADPPPTPGLRDAARRGRLIHALFERLPAVAVPDRRAAADRWLLASEGVTDAALRADVVERVLAVIEDARFADLFGPEALAEAPIAAVVEGGLVVSGTVDRLLVAADRVRVIDFKTGRRAPPSLDELPSAHVRQMAAYVAALEVIFPDRAGEAALLYTAGPALFELPAEFLGARKQRLGAPEQSLDRTP
jgi:ATP-dependent helicase/nuclease subunit A